MSVFNNFNYNFDNSRFGNLINITTDQANTLNIMSNNTTFSPWQISDLANNNIVRTDYYKNPTIIYCTQLISNLINISVSAQYLSNSNVSGSSTDVAAASAILANAANACVIEVSSFGSHTNNISGVSANTGTLTIPTYDMIIATGTQLTMVLSKTDGIANSVSTLGSMTSLFINDILFANTVTIANDANTMVTSNTTITSNTINVITSHVNSVTNILNGRRTSDWFFYSTSVSTLKNYMFLSRFSNPGNTQSQLLNNMIGTDSLKAKLAANTANSS